MKKVLILSFLIVFAIGCNNQPQQIGHAQTNVNTNVSAQKGSDSETVSSHSINSAKPENTKPSPSNQSSNGESSPMAKAIDVAEMTADIEKNEKSFKQKPKDETTKNALAKAYFERASALTGVAQYRAALGDFRKGLKLNPNDEEAKKMRDEILRIFALLNREPPKEGEEPQPLPFEKKKT